VSLSWVVFLRFPAGLSMAVLDAPSMRCAIEAYASTYPAPPLAAFARLGRQRPRRYRPRRLYA